MGLKLNKIYDLINKICKGIIMPDEIFSDEYLMKSWNTLDKKTKSVFILITVHFIIIFLFFSIFFLPNIWQAGLIVNLISNYIGWASWIISIIIILYCRNKLKYHKKNTLFKIIIVLSSIYLILYFFTLISAFIFVIG
ncbi:MAG: hypothetical protein LBH20_08105 [Treponema sp.]|jgi:hypothetical protein|nr:hypothetical protein [Treponema sp.]